MKQFRFPYYLMPFYTGLSCIIYYSYMIFLASFLAFPMLNLFAESLWYSIYLLN